MGRNFRFWKSCSWREVACRPGPREPSADGEFAMSKDPHRRPDPQAFGQSAEDFSDATRRGFETVQGRPIADAEFCLTGWALEIPDIFLVAVAATAD